MEKGRGKILNFFGETFGETDNRNDIQEQLFKATEEGRPLALILKEYFESKDCVNINYKDNELLLSFKIFNKDEQEENILQNVESVRNPSHVMDIQLEEATNSGEPGPDEQQEDHVDGIT